MRLRGISIILLLLVAAPAVAQRMYTSDELIVLLRTGPSTQNAIVRNMRPGTELQVLEADAGNGYSRVRLADGDVEGWVLTQYLSPDRAARDLLADAERNVSAARARIATLETQLGELQTQLRTTRSELASTESDKSNISEELADIRAASANAVALRDQNEALRTRVTQLTAQVDLMAMENAELASRSRQNWFVVGAAVLVGGIIIGLVAPTLRRRRRSSW